MLYFIIYSLLAYGITNIIVFGSIFEPLRDFLVRINPGFLGKLVNCPMCTSTWVGFALSTLFLLTGNITPIANYFILPLVLQIFLDGCLMSGAVWLLTAFEEFLTKEESN